MPLAEGCHSPPFRLAQPLFSPFDQWLANARRVDKSTTCARWFAVNAGDRRRVEPVHAAAQRLRLTGIVGTACRRDGRDGPRVLLATGKLVGEGFDHPPLVTQVLAMPVSWKGTLQRYAGRLHREHASKTDARIIDLVDAGHPALLGMWGKRQPGYRAIGYRIEAEAASYESLL